MLSGSRSPVPGPVPWPDPRPGAVHRLVPRPVAAAVLGPPRRLRGFAREREAGDRAGARSPGDCASSPGSASTPSEKNSPATHPRRMPAVPGWYESHAAALDRNELGALVVAGGPAPSRARVDLPASAQRPARVRGHRCGHRAPGLGRGHRTLAVARKGGKVVTVPLAPRTARAIDLAARERIDGPLFPPGRVACAERAARSYWAQARHLLGRAKRNTPAGKPDAVQARGR